MMNTKNKFVVGLVVLVLATLACGLFSQTDSTGGQDNWEKYNSPEGKFSILFPENTTVDQSFDLDSGVTTTSVETDTLYYAVGFRDTPVDDTTELIVGNVRDIIVNGYINVGGKLLYEKDISLQDYPGMELKFEVPSQETKAIITIITRYYITDKIWYTILVIPTYAEMDTAVQSDVDKFFDSFVIE